MSVFILKMRKVRSCCRGYSYAIWERDITLSVEATCTFVLGSPTRRKYRGVPYTALCLGHMPFLHTHQWLLRHRLFFPPTPSAGLTTLLSLQRTRRTLWCPWRNSVVWLEVMYRHLGGWVGCGWHVVQMLFTIYNRSDFLFGLFCSA